MKTPTVNVITILNTTLQSITSFPDTPEGNREAEDFFKECYKEHNDPEGTTGVLQMMESEFICMLDDGVYDDGVGFQLILSHST